MVRRQRKWNSKMTVEIACEEHHIVEKVGQEVPLSLYYLKGQRPILIAVEDDLCMLRYPNGATLRDVPVKHLVDDAGYWRG